jgi:hypothetical protein
MIRQDFTTYCNRFAGRSGWVVGRGPTLYSYQNLASVDGPVFFINDAVSQEANLDVNCPSFFFAHDESMAVWLGAVKSTAVLIVDHPNSGKGLLSGPDDPLLQRDGQIVLYRQFGEYDPSALLEKDRLEIARSGQLYISTGTIHPLIHFAWYVGCSKLYFIGCDGLPEAGYDSRLPNLSKSKQFGALANRWKQDKLLQALKVQAEYIGTPPHFIQFDCSVTVLDHKQSEFWELINEVMAFARSTECGLQAFLKQSADSSNTFHLRLESKRVDSFLNLMALSMLDRFWELATQGCFEDKPSFLLRTELL